MAAAPATDAEADEETGPKVAVRRDPVGVDLGTANSVPGLRALWRGLLKSRSNAPLSALAPDHRHQRKAATAPACSCGWWRDR